MFKSSAYPRTFVVACAMALILIWSGLAFAGQYSHTYPFDAPVLKDAGNGEVYPFIEDCWAKTSPVGAPVLPRMTGNLYIPAGEELVSLTVECAAPVALSGSHAVTPASPPVPASMAHLAKAGEKDADIYDTDAEYPGVTHVSLGIQMLKGAQLAVFHLCPVQYNPASGEISYYPAMTVTLKTRTVKKGADSMFRNTSSDRAAILDAIDNDPEFIRTSGQARAAAKAGNRQYLIITTTALESAMKKLADHRASTSGGSYNTHIALVEDIDNSQTGVDLAQKIRNYIRSSYQNHGTEYVVLGGDCHGAPGSQTLPTRGCGAGVQLSQTYTEIDLNVPSDLYYGCLDGPWDGNGNGVWGETVDGSGGGDIDWHSEVYVGRINVDSPARALSQINKIIAYETSSKPYKTLLVGEVMDDRPTWGGDKMDWLADYLPSGLGVDKLYDRDQWNKDWPGHMLTDQLSSDEYVWINHLGHSSNSMNMKLNEDDISNINNSNYYFIYTQGCYPGSMDNRQTQSWYYSYEDCIIENMVVADGRGPFAAVANSRYGWYALGKVYDSASNLLHSRFLRQVAGGTLSTGKANQVSKTEIDLTEGMYRWIAFETNLFGDPVSELPSQESTYEGWWAMPGQPGTGLSLETSGNKVFLAWYVYDDAGRPVWYVCLADKNSSVYTGDLLRYTGWPLGAPYKQAVSEVVGSVSLSFLEWNKLNMTAAMTGGVPDTMYFERFMPEAFPGDPDPRDITGWWADSDYMGMGWYVEAYGSTIYVGWYNYREDSSPRWWVLGGDYGAFPSSATSYTNNMIEWKNGQTPGGPYKLPVSSTLDPATITFDGSGGASFTYQGDTYHLGRHTF